MFSAAEMGSVTGWLVSVLSANSGFEIRVFDAWQTAACLNPSLKCRAVKICPTYSSFLFGRGK